MDIKGDHLGVDAQARQVGKQNAEKADKSRGVKNERHGQVSKQEATRSDAIQISQEGRELQTQALGSQLKAPQEQEGVEDMAVTQSLPAHLQHIQDKLETGFYESQEVLMAVTERLLEDLGFPAPDSQDYSTED
mgnify:CR=1 FL=1